MTKLVQPLGKKFLLTAGAIILTSSLLVACASETKTSTPSPTKSSTKTATPTSPSSPSVSASPTPTAFTLTSEAIDKSCESILTLDSLYTLDPNLALTPDQKPTLGQIGPSQDSLGAVSCLVTNLSSGEEVQVVVTKLNEESAKHQLLAMANPVSPQESYQVANGVTGIFESSSGAGTAQFVTGKYWVSLTSKTFTSGIQSSSVSFLVYKNLVG